MSMRLFFVSTLTLLTISPAFSGKHRATEIDKVGKVSIEAGAEIPHDTSWDDMAPFYIGANLKLASGILNTKHFGRNGGIDYGFLYSLIRYYGFKYETDAWRQNVVWKEIDPLANPDCYAPSFVRHKFLIRGTFHYQFLKNLDTYAGVFGGLALVKPKVNKEEFIKAKSYLEKSYGLRAGATWYFNQSVGMGIEWENDFASIYGINNTGTNAYLKLHYLFSEESKMERAAIRKERKLRKLRRDQRELEECIKEGY